jgi:hypothetical protein
MINIQNLIYISIVSNVEHDFQLDYDVILSFEFPKDPNNHELDQANYTKINFNQEQYSKILRTLALVLQLLFLRLIVVIHQHQLLNPINQI